MFPIPSPLHPAVVHFPIALIIVGMVIAVASIFARRCGMQWAAALLLAAGAVGAMVAVATGEEEAGTVGAISEAAESILEEHEEWAEMARNAAIAAAVLAIAAAAASNVRIAGRGLSAAAAVVSIAAAYSVAQAGHYGGGLVYRHGVGVNTSGADAAQPGVAEPGKAHAAEKEHGEHGDKHHDE